MSWNNEKRQQIIDELIENAKAVSKEHQSKIEEWQNLVKAKVKEKEKELFIPGYIPYIGKEYFNASPKILIYALSQNLDGTEKDTSIKWAQAWDTDCDSNNEAIDRQNKGFEECGKIMMGPFDSGHLPALAGILYYLVAGENASDLNILYMVAATNLSKFSFRSEKHTKDSSESLRKCFEWFSKKEIELLKPDYILCASKRVWSYIDIAKLSYKPYPVYVSFPSLLVINRYYSKKKISDSEQAEIDKKINNEIIPIFSKEQFLQKETRYKTKETVEDIIKRDSRYFAEMFNWLKEQLSKHASE